MRYIVSRTSIRDDAQPCDEVKQGEFVRVDVRSVSSPEKLRDQSDRENWYNKGTNHRVRHRRIMRDFPITAWYIELDTLEALMKFAAKHNEVIISSWFLNQNEWSIEIYDDYRE